jgi:pimeloyl-ACP methyl ester carboxylesterase
MVVMPVLERVTRAVLVRRGVTSRHIDTPIARVHVYDAPGEGSGKPVVLLHGIAASATPFAPLLARLRKSSRRVLAIDAPGHGLSSAPRSTLDPERLFESVKHVLDRELHESALVVGCSLGGAMALKYAGHSADRVAGLVLASPGGAPVEDPVERERFLRLFEVENFRDARAFLERLHHQVPWYGPVIVPDLIRLFKNPAVRSILRSVRPEHFFKPEDLSSLEMPIRVLWGRSDRIIPASCLEFFKQNLPAHTIFEEPHGVGHSPHIDAPRMFLTAIDKSLDEVSRRGGTQA